MKNENRAEIIMCVFGVGFGVLTTFPLGFGKAIREGERAVGAVGFLERAARWRGERAEPSRWFSFCEGLGDGVGGHGAPSQLPVTSILA